MTAVIRRTKFSDGYLLEKAKAIAASAREPLPACYRIVNLLHEAFPHYSWTGLYLRRDRQLSLLFHRGSTLTAPESHEPIEGLLGWAVRSRRTQIVPDAAQDPRYAHIEIPIQSEIMVPIKLKGRGLGVLDICSGQPRAFDRLDIGLLEAVAETLAPSVAALLSAATAVEMPVPSERNYG